MERRSEHDPHSVVVATKRIAGGEVADLEPQSPSTDNG